MRGDERAEPDIAARHNGRIVAENGQQRLAPEEDERHHDGKDDHALGNAQQQRALAAADLPRAEVLPDEGGAGLTEGAEDIISDDLDIERGARRGHDHRAKAVDRRLDDYI